MSALLKKAWDVCMETATWVDKTLCAPPQNHVKTHKYYYVENAILEGRLDAECSAKKPKHAGLVGAHLEEAGAAVGSNAPAAQVAREAASFRAENPRQEVTAHADSFQAKQAKERLEAHAALFPAGMKSPIEVPKHAAPPAALAAPAGEYEGDELKTMVAELPAANAELVTCMMFDRAAETWAIGRLICRKAVRVADGSLEFLMNFTSEEPAGSADVELPHSFSLGDLAYLKELDIRIPLQEHDKDFSMFGVAQ